MILKIVFYMVVLSFIGMPSQLTGITRMLEIIKNEVSEEDKPSIRINITRLFMSLLFLGLYAWFSYYLARYLYHVLV